MNTEVRIEELAADMNAGFKELSRDMNAGFKEMVTYIEKVEDRFEQVENRFEKIEADIKEVKTSMATKEDLAALNSRMFTIESTLRLILERLPEK